MTVNTVACSTEDYEVVVLCLCESGRTLLPRDLVNGMQQAVRLHIVPKRGDFRPQRGPVISPAARPYLFAYDASSQLCRGEDS
jgi:hypothetical protein